MCVCFQVCPVLLALVSKCVYVFRCVQSCWPWSVNVCMFSGVCMFSVLLALVSKCVYVFRCGRVLLALVSKCVYVFRCVQSCWPWSVNVCMFSGVCSLVGLGQ